MSVTRKIIFLGQATMAVDKKTVAEDENVRRALPGLEGVPEVSELPRQSAWAQPFRVDVQDTGGGRRSYFLKVSFGEHGREALKGEFTSTQAIYAIVPEFCVEPIAWGSFASDGDVHFYLSTFYDFRGSGKDHMPSPKVFCRQLAALHQRSKSPTGRFGFECVTYNGNIPQDNTWHDHWETAFANGLRHVLQVREKRVGPHPRELKTLLGPLFDAVIPRLLRPLESHGRSVKPSLVHGDLWCGNVSVCKEEPKIYDPASFYAHHEYELGNWHPERNKFDGSYFKAYHANIEPSKPKRDFRGRILLYSLRFNLHASIMFPNEKIYMDQVIETMQTLVDRYGRGRLRSIIEAIRAMISKK